MEKIKKTIAVLLILLLTLGRLLPTVVLAEELGEGGDGEEQQVEPTVEPAVEPEVLPDPSPTPEPGIGIDNEAEVTSDVDSTAITGENTIEEPTPTPSPSADAVPAGEPEGTDEPSCQVEIEGDCPEEPEQTAEPELTVEPEATDEPEATPEETSEPTPSEIDTGDAASVVEAENSVNSTEINSQVIYHTLNIFVSGDIDLTTDPLAIAQDVFADIENAEPVVNVAFTDINNIAYLSNDIVSFANTGDNTIEGGEQAVIDTGDAYSIVSLLNKVNTTIVDSTIHIITINIFGDVEGNILLPELFSESGDACCGESTQIENSATVENEVGSSAVSGQNTITTTDTEGASIDTGDASSVVNLTNIVNTNFIGVVFHHLFINILGGWLGDFLGWDNFEAINGGESLSLNSTDNGNNGGGDCPTCSGDVSIGNEAHVTNNVSSTANTGGNSIEGDGGDINTGQAYSAVSIFNFVNTSIIRSTGFFGSINIFGFLEGDIGGASLFAGEELEPEPEAEEAGEAQEEDASDNQGEPGPSIREAGGELNIYQYNNVGAHVLPGDTVTFFITVRNPGTGRVYDAVLDLGLIKDEVDVGGGVFELGDIKQGEGVKITTGMVLSEDAEPGNYLAHAEVFGYVGPNNDLISAYSDSFFKIAGYSPLPMVPGIVQEVQAVMPEEEVLGTINLPAGLTLEQKFGLLLALLLVLYLPTKGYQKREELAAAFSRSRSFLGSKSAAFRTFLTSFLA